MNQHRAHVKFKLRNFLMILLLSMLLPIMLVAGVFFYHSAQQTASVFIQNQARAVGERISDRVVGFFDVPTRVATFNLQQAQAGLLNYDNPDDLMRQFLLQIRQQPLLTFISMGMADGEYYAGARPPLNDDKSLQMINMRIQNGRLMHLYQVDEDNNIGQLLVQGKTPIDVRVRSWFKSGLQKGGIAWYPVYHYLIDDDRGSYNTLGIGVSAPMYAKDGHFMGVFTADVALSQLNNCLSRAIDKTGGIAFIAQQDGTLLASSTPESLYYADATGFGLISMSKSDNLYIRAAGHLIDQNQVRGEQKIMMGDEGYWLDWRSYQLPNGPKLTMVVLLPEKQFNAPLEQMLHQLIYLGVVVLVMSLLMVLWVSGWVASPLLALSQWASELAQANWHTKPPQISPICEVRILSHSLSDMANNLQSITQDLEQANAQLLNLSHTDGLTGIANRRYFDEVLAREWDRAKRSQRPISLIMLDVDWFKLFNDHYGHQAGDDCLKAIAQVLKTYVQRANELPARYGGEEFVVILAETDIKQAAAVAESLRAKVEALAIAHQHSPLARVTISLGVACVIPDMDTDAVALIKRADDALYKAKEKGRNQVQRATECPLMDKPTEDRIA
jgi:diguanylate cyclase (GGDEF)-like protein